MAMQLQYHASHHPGSANDIRPATGAPNAANLYAGHAVSGEGNYYSYAPYTTAAGKIKSSLISKTTNFLEVCPSRTQ